MGYALESGLGPDNALSDLGNHFSRRMCITRLSNGVSYLVPLYRCKY